jgi:predicted N-formylglutamate amidohydrolase
MTARAATDGPPRNGPPVNQVAEVMNLAGAGDFLIVCEHASNFIPASFAGLGLEGAALESHIAWDPGNGSRGFCMTATARPVRTARCPR